MIGMYETIEVSFMVPGHTKFLSDGYFGNIKALFRKTRVNTVDDVEKVVKSPLKIILIMLFAIIMEMDGYIMILNHF